MSDPEQLHPVRRFLHICYVCRDIDAASAFLAQTLGMREVMRAAPEPVFDTLLGFDRQVESPTLFMYDHRGGRVSPSIEVQHYIEPPTVGAPSLDPFEIGVKALGITVPDVAEAVAKMVAAGSTVKATGTSPFGDTWTTIVDPNDVTFELVEDSALAGPSQMRHLRITVSDLSKSIAWYENLGFQLLGEAVVDDAAFVGHAGPVTGRAARLRLPDEPFEVVLVEWTSPRGHGAHYATPNHAGLFRCAVQVFDTVAATQAMKAAGTEFVRGPIHFVLTGTAEIDMWLSFLADPDGILYEFVGRPASAFVKS
jgi:catechol 2,3-dioxygenase-like lactoylglutathione lyase family enzyme